MSEARNLFKLWRYRPGLAISMAQPLDHGSHTLYSDVSVFSKSPVLAGGNSFLGFQAWRSHWTSLAPPRCDNILKVSSYFTISSQHKRRQMLHQEDLLPRYQWWGLPATALCIRISIIYVVLWEKRGSSPGERLQGKIQQQRRTPTPALPVK